MEDGKLYILHNQYHGCRQFGDTRSLGISSNDFIIKEYLESENSEI